MNFRTPQKAAQYFRDFYNKYRDLVDKVWINHINYTNLDPAKAQKGKILIPGYEDATPNADGYYTLDRSRVESTGNIICYTGDKLQFYTANVTDATSLQVVKNQQSRAMKKWQNLYSSLDEDIALPSSNLLTENIVNMDHVDETVDAVVPIQEGDNTYKLAHFVMSDKVRDFYENSYNNNGDKRIAYMITSTGDVTITGDKIKISHEDGTSAEFKGVKDDEVNTEAIKAGIVIAKGNVTVEDTDFWGTIIAQGNITLTGSNTKVYALSTQVEYLIKNSETVFPYFNKKKKGTQTGDGSELDLVTVIYDNWKKD